MENLELIADTDLGVIHTSGKDQEIGQNDIWNEMTTIVPDSIGNVIPKLREAIKNYIEQRGFLFDDDDEECLSKLSECLHNMNAELTGSIERASWESGESTWGEFSTGVNKQFLLSVGEEGKGILESIAEETFLDGDDDIDEDEFYENIDQYIAKVTDEMVEEYIEGSPMGTSVKYEFDRAAGIDQKKTEFEMF